MPIEVYRASEMESKKVPILQFFPAHDEQGHHRADCRARPEADLRRDRLPCPYRQVVQEQHPSPKVGQDLGLGRRQRAGHQQGVHYRRWSLFLQVRAPTCKFRFIIMKLARRSGFHVFTEEFFSGGFPDLAQEKGLVVSGSEHHDDEAGNVDEDDG